MPEPPADGPLSNATIMQAAITVEDLDEGIAYYRDRLGMRFLFRAPNMAFLDCGGTRIALGQQTEDTANQGVYLYFRVQDIHATAAQLKVAGVTLKSDPSKIATVDGNDVWLAAFDAPAGITHHVISETPTGSTAT